MKLNEFIAKYCVIIFDRYGDARNSIYTNSKRKAHLWAHDYKQIMNDAITAQIYKLNNGVGKLNNGIGEKIEEWTIR